MNRTQFTFYESFYKALSRIRGRADRAKAYEAIVRFALYGEEPDLNTLSPAAAIALEGILPNLAAGRRKAMGGMRGRKEKDTRKIPASDPEQEKEEVKDKEQMFPPLSPDRGERRGEALSEALRKLREGPC